MSIQQLKKFRRLALHRAWLSAKPSRRQRRNKLKSRSCELDDDQMSGYHVILKEDAPPVAWDPEIGLGSEGGFITCIEYNHGHPLATVQCAHGRKVKLLLRHLRPSPVK